MAWISIIATGLSSFASYVAAEWASGLKEGKLLSKLALSAAVLFFFGSIAALVCFPPTVGLQRYLVVAMTGATALASFWFAKSHVDHFRGKAALVASLLGLASSSLGFVVFIDKLPEYRVQLPGTEPPETLEQWVARVSKKLTTQRKEFQRRLNEDIPKQQRELESQATAAKTAIANASAGTKVKLEEELKQIARLLVTLEKKQHQYKNDLIPRIESEERRLARAGILQALEGDADIQRQVDDVWKSADTAIGMSVVQPLESDVGDAEVQNKINELLQ